MESIIAGLVALAGIVLSFHGGRLLARAQAIDTNAKSIETLNGIVNQLLKDREDDIERVKALENTIDELKAAFGDYFDRLMAYFQERGLTDYPKPPKKLFDTHDRMKAAK